MPDEQPPGWRLVPRFLLRRAGFGFGLLDPVACRPVTETAARYRSAVRTCLREREELLRQVLPDAVRDCRERDDRETLRWLSAVRGRIGRARPLPDTPARLPSTAGGLARYAEAHTDMVTAERALCVAVTDERADRAARVATVIDPTVLDALVQLAPSFYDGLRRWQSAGRSAGTSRDRALLRRLYLFVQRLAAKNETTSFFGPLVYGTFDPTADGIAPGAGGSGGTVETRAFVAFWAVCALARRFAEDPAVRDDIPVTWVPASRLAGRVLVLADGREVTLPLAVAEVAAQVDGSRSARRIAERTGLDPGTTRDALDRLRRLGAVRIWPEPASTAVQPLDQLIEDVRETAKDSEWPRRLDVVRELARRWGEATGHSGRRAALIELEEEFERLTGSPPRRAGGQMYADRMVVYQDARGDGSPVRLGTEQAVALERALTPVLDLAAAYGSRLHRAHRELAAEVLRAAGTTRMRYDEFIRRAGAAVADGGLRERFGAADDFQAAFAGLVREGLTGQHATLAPARLRRLAPPGGGPRFASPDVLVRRADDGGPRFVLGEIHPYVFAWGSQGLFAEDADGLRAAFDAVLAPWGGRQAMATVVRRRRHKGLLSEWFPGRFIEAAAVATRDRERALPLTALWVRADGDEVRLTDGHTDLVLYTGDDDHSHLMAFAPPPVRLPLVRFADHAPRVVVGDLVVQRASWWLAGHELFGSAARRGCGDPQVLVRVQDRRARLDIPRWVYAHVADEPKPICVDLDSPLAVEALAATVAARPEGEVRLVEMLPEPTALWLRGPDGPVTSELRLALVREAG